MSTDLMVPSNHLILCCPLLLLPSVFLCIRVFFQWVGSLHQVARDLELQFLHQSFQWIFRVSCLSFTGLISLQCMGLSSLFQHYSLEASLWCSAFFMIQLSHLYMTTGKTIVLTIWTFVGKVKIQQGCLSWFGGKFNFAIYIEWTQEESTGDALDSEKMCFNMEDWSPTAVNCTPLFESLMDDLIKCAFNWAVSRCKLLLSSLALLLPNYCRV